MEKIKHGVDILRSFKYQQHPLLRKTCWIYKTNVRTVVDVAYSNHGPNPSDSTKHILVLHGLLGSKRNWKSISKNIASINNASVISTEARNHGDSPFDSSHTYWDLTADASQLLTKLSLNKVNILGHSMGGRTGMLLALTEPSKVHSLIVVDVSPVPGAAATSVNKFTKFLKAMRSVNFQDCDTIEKARTAVTETLLASGTIRDMSGYEFVLHNIKNMKDNTFGWNLNLDVLIDHFRGLTSFPPETLGKIYSGPVLFIGGGQSEHLPKSHEAAIKETFPQAEIKYMDHVKHNPHLEDPTTFLKIVNDFYAVNL